MDWKRPSFARKVRPNGETDGNDEGLNSRGQG
jgi:hypothetical protein